MFLFENFDKVCTRLLVCLLTGAHATGNFEFLSIQFDCSIKKFSNSNYVNQRGGGGGGSFANKI